MITIISTLHNIVRWVIVVFAAIALLRAYLGWLRKRDWTDTDRHIGVFFTSTLDLQLLLGIILIILGGLTELGGFAYVHIALMFIAILLAHGGNVLSRRDNPAIIRHRWSAIFDTVALLIIFFAIPWWKPLVPGI
jgi:archaellum biogenesis protein FlaJ (TadC family)